MVRGQLDNLEQNLKTELATTEELAALRAVHSNTEAQLETTKLALEEARKSLSESQVLGEQYRTQTLQVEAERDQARQRNALNTGLSLELSAANDKVLSLELQVTQLQVTANDHNRDVGRSNNLLEEKDETIKLLHEKLVQKDLEAAEWRDEKTSIKALAEVRYENLKRQVLEGSEVQHKSWKEKYDQESHKLKGQVSTEIARVIELREELKACQSSNTDQVRRSERFFPSR